MLKAINIKWDTDNKETLQDLPKEMVIPYDLEVNYNPDDPYQEEISDWLSDKVGFCHEGFELEKGNFEQILNDLKTMTFQDVVNKYNDLYQFEIPVECEDNIVYDDEDLYEFLELFDAEIADYEDNFVIIVTSDKSDKKYYKVPSEDAENRFGEDRADEILLFFDKIEEIASPNIFSLRICKFEILNCIEKHENYDSWGDAEYGNEEKAVDHNLCIDNSAENTEYNSAFYRIFKNEKGLWEHDKLKDCYPYEIDFSDEYWTVKLKEAAKKAYKELWKE